MSKQFITFGDRTMKRPKYRPLIYICSPFSGNIEENTKRAIEFAKFAFEQNCIPLTPHLLFPFMDDNVAEERDLAIFMGIILMGKCEEVWVLGEKNSEGMKIEIEKATRRKQPVRYFNNQYEEVKAL